MLMLGQGGFATEAVGINQLASPIAMRMILCARKTGAAVAKYLRSHVGS